MGTSGTPFTPGRPHRALRGSSWVHYTPFTSVSPRTPCLRWQRLICPKVSAHPKWSPPGAKKVQNDLIMYKKLPRFAHMADAPSVVSRQCGLKSAPRDPFQAKLDHFSLHTRPHGGGKAGQVGPKEGQHGLHVCSSGSTWRQNESRCGHIGSKRLKAVPKIYIALFEQPAPQKERSGWQWL